jgi:transposase-like protein
MVEMTFKNLRKLTEPEAREMLEAIRWPNGAECPHCGNKEAYKLEAVEGTKTHARPGTYKCASCREQFSVTVGTIFESSRIKLADWLMAIYLMCSSKKGISAHQLHRTLGVTYKTAWFMAHRIRFAMTQEPLRGMLSGTVEADETYIGGKARGKRGRGAENKTPVFALVQRDGKMMARKVNSVNASTLKGIIREHVSKDATIMTDKFLAYRGLKREFKSHKMVDHGAGQYVKGDCYTNTLEGWFSLLKRGVNGTFHHVSEKHLDRYIDEFVFRYNRRNANDADRAIMAVINTKGKRLQYKNPIRKE